MPEDRREYVTTTDEKLELSYLDQCQRDTVKDIVSCLQGYTLKEAELLLGVVRNSLPLVSKVSEIDWKYEGGGHDGAAGI